MASCHLHTFFSLKSELYSTYRGSFSILALAARRTGDWAVGAGGRGTVGV